MRTRASTVTVVLLLLSACVTEPCTLSIEPAITVRALDVATGQNVTEGAQGTVTEGTYTDSLRPLAVDEAGHVLLLSAADERPGTYAVFVEHPDYQAVSLSGVRVTRGACHVRTVSLDVTMVAIPQAVGARVLSNPQMQPTTAGRPELR